ncbi:hypothetical protein E2562_029784 [Oryza meyeriana var. granulata]|uniref:Uncharacterized protein n=1 Tax=Oryza meyeriana var. granulata TaxID=110450 RepID=A0A6G1E445_9ORYZ|nr:hypothetical protein E2562_029784 [Oryza meyeriana var. granulata]
MSSAVLSALSSPDRGTKRVGDQASEERATRKGALAKERAHPHAREESRTLAPNRTHRHRPNGVTDAVVNLPRHHRLPRANAVVAVSLVVLARQQVCIQIRSRRPLAWAFLLRLPLSSPGVAFSSFGSYSCSTLDQKSSSGKYTPSICSI